LGGRLDRPGQAKIDPPGYFSAVRRGGLWQEPSVCSNHFSSPKIRATGVGNKRAPLIGPQRLAHPLRRLAIGVRSLLLHTCAGKEEGYAKFMSGRFSQPWSIGRINFRNNLRPDRSLLASSLEPLDFGPGVSVSETSAHGRNIGAYAAATNPGSQSGVDALRRSMLGGLRQIATHTTG
jgi:hypothetical protein